MLLPNHEQVRVPKEKITAYLLSPSHEDGRHKETFFRGHGFCVENWETLAAALRRHAVEHEVTKQVESVFGVRYSIEGRMATPGGRSPLVRTIWFIATGERTARFVTAYPIKRIRR